MITLVKPDCLPKAAVKKTISNTKNPRSPQACFAVSLLFALSHNAAAATFNLPNGTDSLIDNSPGKPFYVKAKQEDSLIDIAIEFLLGQEEIVSANKAVDRWLPGAGKEVLIPTSYVLPNAPRQGIVINLPEYRLYYYPSATPYPNMPVPAKGKKTRPTLTSAPPSIVYSSIANQSGKVISYSVGIGRVDWKTPLGVTKVVGKVKDPTWTPPASIKAEHLAKGDPLPDVWAAGPDNPLGLFAFRLGIPGYLLHSTNKPQGVGMQVSHGCMRLYPKDIEQMFPIVGIGTPVNIINQPIKVGWSNGRLYLEAHPNLEGEETSSQQRLDTALDLIAKISFAQPIEVNRERLNALLEAGNGLPTLIYASDSGLPESPVQEREQGQDNIYLNESTLPPPVLNRPPVESAPVLVRPPVVSIPVIAPQPIESKEQRRLREEIKEELRQEEEQEREFKNSPFPIR